MIFGISTDELWAQAREKLMRFVRKEHRGHKINGEPSECWIFTGTHSGHGRGGLYGRIRYRGIRWAAHRLSYRAHVGPIREGMDIDHCCNQRPCINPEHLEEVTGGENQKRRARRATTRIVTEAYEHAHSTKPVHLTEVAPLGNWDDDLGET